MIMANTNRNFINNVDLDEQNSFPHLLETMNPESEEEANLIEDSEYFNNDEHQATFRMNSQKLSILNLNCQSINAKFDKIKLFLECIDNNSNPVSIITLQESWGSELSDMNYFNLPNYTLVYDDYRLSSHGGLITYIHNSFDFRRLDILEYNQISTVYESIIIEICKKISKFNKYIIGNIYRRPSDSVDELTLFIEEISTVLSKLNKLSQRSYICGDFNINLLNINNSDHCNNFFEGITTLGFLPQITRPTRLSNDSNTLIDNIFTNNICKPHKARILVTPISDHLMQFCVIIGNFQISNHKTKYVEIESLNPQALNNFKLL